MMPIATSRLAAPHLAVLGDSDDQVCAVVVFDGHRRPHLHPVAASTARLSGWLTEPLPGQLPLPLGGCWPPASSSGRTWRTWVLPSIPTCLRTLPPDRLAAAFAGLLCDPSLDEVAA